MIWLVLLLAFSQQHVVSGVSLHNALLHRAHTQQAVITKDAPFSVNKTAIESTVTCLNDTITGRPGGVVLLVHGTGSTGNETWQASPYTQILPFLTPGYDVCYLTLPNRSQTDIQVTSEYVAGNIGQLAKKSKTGKVSLIGHSQGNLNIQWALNFWPSRRQYVHHFVSVAGDFHGTTEVATACELVGILNTFSGNCTQAFFQQMNTLDQPDGKMSTFLTALNHFGNTALVPTTSLYTLMDNVIQNEKGANATSIVLKADNILARLSHTASPIYTISPDSLHFVVIQLQDPRACNDSHSVDHFTIVTDPGAFALAYGAISQAPGTILTDWNPAYCDDYIGKGGIGTFFKKMLNEGPTWYSMMADSLSVFPYGTAQNETKLLPYVCASGSAPKEQCI